MTVDKSEVAELQEKIDAVMAHLRRQDRNIARNQKLLTAHINKLAPYFEGLEAAKLLLRILKYVAGGLLAVAGGYITFRLIFPFLP